VDNQRLLLYVSLALVLYLIWLAWQQDYGPRPVAKVRPQTPIPSTVERAPAQAKDVPEAPQFTPVKPPKPNDRGLPVGQRIHVVTDVLDIELDTRGGDIRRAALPLYPAQANKPNTPFVLLHANQRLGLYIAQSGLIHDRTVSGAIDIEDLAPSHHAIYMAERRDYRLKPGSQKLTVPLTWQGPRGVTVKKVFTFHRGEYLVDVSHTVINRGKQTWSGRQYRQLRHGPIRSGETSRLLYTYTGAAYFDGKYEKIPFDDMQSEPLSRVIKGGWVAMLEHYFVSAWVPGSDERNLYYTNVLREDGIDQYLIGLRSTGLTVAPQEVGAFHTRIFLGPKLQRRLGEIANGLDLVVDYGIFTVLAKPLFWLLSFIHGLIGNWGWAIVMVTVVIKLAFYKLSEASYRSMAKMRAVQPRMQALKERFTSDKQKLNQALMELYKNEKINPLGGCLPVIVQIPVFIALYWVLLESVELRQADFMLWINDLSNRDPYFVLPVLMGITMFAQQRLNPAPLDPIQAKMMMVLPLVFTVFFAFFPAGLVLYWFVNNLLSIAQQWVITRRIEAVKA
jgi:YidC/Oxa1 family membrane protein insertase